MFEAEVEMERRSSFLPMLLLVCLVAAILGMGTYVVFQVRTRTPLNAQEASKSSKQRCRGQARRSFTSAADWWYPVSLTNREIRTIDSWKRQEL